MCLALEAGCEQRLPLPEDGYWPALHKYIKVALPYLHNRRRYQYPGYKLGEIPPNTLGLILPFYGMDPDEYESVEEHTTDCGCFWVINVYNRIGKPVTINYVHASALLYVHDGGEYHAGEISVKQGKPEDFATKERAGFIQLLQDTECYDPRLVDLFDEFEAAETPEALFAKFIDRYQGNFYFLRHQQNLTEGELDISFKRVNEVMEKLFKYLTQEQALKLYQIAMEEITCARFRMQYGSMEFKQ